MFQQFAGGAIALHFSASWCIHAVTLMTLIAIYLGCGFRGIAVEHRTSSIQLLGPVLRAAQSSEVLLFCMTWERHVSLGSV